MNDLLLKRLSFPEVEFNLSSFKKFAVRFAEEARGANGLVIDFQNVQFWDPAALLWFSLAVKERREAGVDIRLRLPDVDAYKLEPYVTEGKVDSMQKSADFLRRWRYDLVLKRLGGVGNVLVDEQENFFHSGRQEEYISATVLGPDGHRQEVMSKSLFPFCDFAAFEHEGLAPDKEIGVGSPVELPNDQYRLCISRAAVNGMVQDLNTTVVADILSEYCAITRRGAHLFASKVITEALDNMEKHPDATFGMMAINKSKRERKLCLAVVDDGESICKTMMPTYNEAFGGSLTYEEARECQELAGAVLDYATYPEVSSKPDSSGMGLYYIKHHSLYSLGGQLQVLTANVLSTYSKDDGENSPRIERWPHSWEGNLIRVEIPIGGRHE